MSEINFHQTFIDYPPKWCSGRVAVYHALEHGFDYHDWQHGNFSFLKIFIHQGLEEMMIKEAEYKRYE